MVQSQDMAQKLQTTYAADGDMPDIAWCEASYRGQLLSLPIWQDISKAPYSVDTSKILPWLIPLETSPTGTYVGPEAPSAGGMMYKRNLAKQYLGTDDPSEVAKLFPNWGAFIQKGIQVKQASKGKVFMLAGVGEAYTIFSGQTSTPFVIGTKLNLEQGMKPILQQLIQMKQAGILDVMDENSPALGASYTNNTDIFYPCASWSPDYTIITNDKSAASTGNWGFFVPPGGPFPMGGTMQGVPAKAKNKMGAVALIKYVFLTTQGAEDSRDLQGNFSPLKTTYNNPTFYNTSTGDQTKIFGGQNFLETMSTDVFPKINVNNIRKPTKYDGDITDAANAAIKTINASSTGNVNVDDLISSMTKILLAEHPELSAG